MVGQEGAKSSLLNIGLCENVSIFLGKARIQWQNAMPIFILKDSTISSTGETLHSV